ncbi:MAG: hypothetical protein AAGI34_13760 [Pseudomonadota bacterium]
MAATPIPPDAFSGLDVPQRRVLRLFNEAAGQMMAEPQVFPRHTVQAAVTFVEAVLAEAKDDGSAKALTDVYGAFIAHQSVINAAVPKIEAEIYCRTQAESTA